MQNNSIPLSFSKLSNKTVSVEITKVKAQISFQVVTAPCNQTAMELFSALIHMLFLKINVLLSTQIEISHKITKPTVFYLFIAKYFVEQH